jgi:hypothetical protein
MQVVPVFVALMMVALAQGAAVGFLKDITFNLEGKEIHVPGSLFKRQVPTARPNTPPNNPSNPSNGNNNNNNNNNTPNNNTPNNNNIAATTGDDIADTTSGFVNIFSKN